MAEMLFLIWYKDRRHPEVSISEIGKNQAVKLIDRWFLEAWKLDGWREHAVGKEVSWRMEYGSL